MRERDRNIKRLGKQNKKENKIYFGRIVYSYDFHESELALFLGENKLVFTCKPKCRNSHPFPLNYAKTRMMGFL